MYSPKVLFGFIAVIACVSAYQNGAPCDICDTMNPGHGVSPQTGRFPYEVVLDKTVVRCGETITVTIRGKYCRKFKGFMIEGIYGNEAIGHFGCNTGDSHTLDCGSGTANAATHSNSYDKRNTSLTWTAPCDYQKRIEVFFYLTLVRSYDYYWVKQRCSSVTVEPA